MSFAIFKKLIHYILLFSVAGLPARASTRERGIDWSLGAGARTLPIGGAVFTELGWNLPLWGNWRDETEFIYSYLRPSVRYTNALAINALDFSFGFYPVSFLGLTAGRTLDSRGKDASASADCAVYQCDGLLRSDFGGVNLLLGAHGVFLASELEWRDYEADSGTEDFYEESYALVGRRAHDRVFSQTHTLGKKWRRGELFSWFDGFIGIGGRRSEAMMSGSFSQRFSLIVSHSEGPWRISAVAGPHESSLLPAALAFGAQVELIGAPGMALK